MKEFKKNQSPLFQRCDYHSNFKLASLKHVKLECTFSEIQGTIFYKLFQTLSKQNYLFTFYILIQNTINSYEAFKTHFPSFLPSFAVHGTNPDLIVGF